MGKETTALLLITVVHVVGVAVLLWAVLGSDTVDPRGWWRGDDPPDPPGPVAPPPSGGGVPLADADPAALRLRTEHERLADGRRRTRRPQHAPQRTREPA